MAPAFPNQTLLGLDAQIQFQLPVKPLVVPAKPFDVSKMQKAQTKAPVRLMVGQSHQPVRDLSVLAAQFGLIAVAGLTDAEHPAGQTNANMSFINGFLR